MANLTLSIDDKTKKRFTRFCDGVGLSASSVLTVCINTIVRENRIPFIIEGPPRPTRETLDAIAEGERLAADPDAPTYTDLDQLWADLAK